MLEDKSYNKLFYSTGNKGSGPKNDLTKVLLALLICWLPLAIITLFTGSFWTGEITSSFITDFDIQVRLLVSMPILILADREINLRLSLIFNQFTNCGIIGKDIKEKFETIIQSNVQFLKSIWISVILLILCYVQVFAVFYFEMTSTSVLTWQVFLLDGETVFNLAGYWSAFISIPFVLFLVYKWLLRIIVWGIILFKISKLKINLFPFHPDLSGGLGFLGYSIRYFSPIAFAFSAIVAANAADFMLIEGIHLVELKLPLIGYLIVITCLFTFPLFFFTQTMFNWRERSVYEDYDYTNGVYRELKVRMNKEFEEVNKDDLKLMDFSAATDLSSVIEKALNMKSVPFTLKDNFPLWIMTAAPFMGLILIEYPMNEIFSKALALIL